jgi:hypothetical protein
MTMKKIYILICCIVLITQRTESQDYVIRHYSSHEQNHFGWSISSDNDYVAVSDPRDSVKYYANGCVYIYKKYGYEWQYLQTLQNKEIKAYDYFGHRVYMSGNYLAVTSIGDRDMGFMAGAVHVYYLDKGTWTYLQTLRQPEAKDKSYFGEALYISGSNLFVGAPGYGVNGKAFVYNLSEGSFKLLQKIDDPDSLSTQFGKSIACSSDRLYVGAPTPNRPGETGSVFVYIRNGTLWEPDPTQSVIKPDDSNDGSLFGYCISVEDNMLLIGAPHSSVTSMSNEDIYFAGKAYYYTFSKVTGKYTKVNEFVNPHLDSHDLFGSNVMISDSLFYISAPKDDVSEEDDGNVYILNSDKGEWIYTSLNDNEFKEKQYFGHTFFVDGWNLFVAPAGDKVQKDKGELFTYDVRNFVESPKDKEEIKEVINLFPNPADETLRITITVNTTYTFRMFSNDGKEILSTNLKGNKEIDVSNFGSGYYLVSINTEKQSFTEKFVIKHRKK